MIYEEKIGSLLTFFNQMQLEKEIFSLNSEKKRKLYEQLLLLKEEREEEIFSQKLVGKILPLSHCSKSRDEERVEAEKYFEKKTLGVVVLASGQATRLKFNKPKGFFPISLYAKKSLFQLVTEKIVAARKKYEADISLTFMVQREAREMILTYFEEKNYFGLDPKSLFFFSQRELPLLGEDRRWFLDQKQQVATGPNGNGDFFSSFFSSGLLKFFEERGVEHFSVIPIDNPLADPLGLALLPVHLNEGNEVTLGAIEGKQFMLKAGGLALKDGHLCIAEYCEGHDLSAFHFFNPGLYLFSSSFIKKMSPISLPLHAAYKKIVYQQGEKNVVKREKFIFDCLEYTQKSSAVLIDAEDHFAPLKDEKGVEYVRSCLLKKDQKILSSFLGKNLFDVSFELSMDFHYPKKSLLDELRREKLSFSKYIEANLE